MPSERDPLLREKKEPDPTQGGGVQFQFPQPPETSGAGTEPPSSTNSSPASVTTAELQRAEIGQNENVANENSTGNDRGEGSPGTGGGSGQGTTNEATEGDSNANEVKTFLVAVVLLTFLKNCHKTFIALFKAFWKNKWLKIALVLFSLLYTLFFAPKMPGLTWYDWILSNGLLDLVAILSIWKVDDVANKISDGIQAVDAKVDASNTEVNTKLDVLIALFQKMEMEKTLEKSDVTDFTGEEAGAGAESGGESSPRALPAIVDDEHGDESLAGEGASNRTD